MFDGVEKYPIQNSHCLAYNKKFRLIILWRYGLSNKNLNNELVMTMGMFGPALTKKSTVNKFRPNNNIIFVIMPFCSNITSPEILLSPKILLDQPYKVENNTIII